MSGRQRLNLDTSILLNYVYAKLPGEIEEDRGGQRLLESTTFYCVIGPKADSEFDAVCERRFELYNDLLNWLEENPDQSIYEYDPTQRAVQTSPHDINHLRYEVLHGWANEPRRKQLSDIRRCAQDLGRFHKLLPSELLDQVYKQLTKNDDLFDALDGLELDHDREIVVDAVEICRKDSIDVLMAIDSDITDDEQITAINKAIRNIECEDLCLEIVEPDGV